MSKELTPLEWLYYYKEKLQSSGQTIRPNGFNIIETALKEYSMIKQHLAKNGIDSFEEFIDHLYDYIKISEEEHEELMMLRSQSYKK